MNSYIEIIRPGNVVMAVIAVVLVAIVADSYTIPVLLGMLSVFFAISGGNVINDVFDYKIDSINRPDRPIPSGRISLENARKYAYSLFILSVLVSFITSYLVQSIYPTVVVLFAVIILYFYASNLKSTVLLGNFIVGFLTGLCFIFAGVIIGFDLGDMGLIGISSFLGFFALLMTFAREITKDIEDIEGDTAEGVKTFPIVYGAKTASYLAAFFAIVDCILCPLLYFTHIFNILYLIVIAVAVIIFLYGAILILQKQDPKTCHKVSKLLKIGMLIAFVSFVLGSI